MKNLSDWLAHCERLHPRSIELGLDRSRGVADRMGLRFDCPVITVAGTNGKGSTCAMMEAILLQAGYRTGVYSSPHLVHFEERCRLLGDVVAATDGIMGPMSKTITVYGIVNCDTVKNARAWLQDHGIDYRFHDFKKQGLPPDQADRWIAAAGWEALVNRKGTTWRKLDRAAQAAVVDAPSARALMQEHVSVIKRPVVEWGDTVSVGFDPVRWEQIAASRV